MLQLLLRTKWIRWKSALRTTGPLFRTYEPSDYRTFITESCKSRNRTYEPSDCRTFGMKNSLFRTHEPSDYRTFALESSHRKSPQGTAIQRIRYWQCDNQRVWQPTPVSPTGRGTTWNCRVHGLSVYPVWVCDKVRLGQDTTWNRREHRLSVSPNWVCTMLGGYKRWTFSDGFGDKPSHSIRCVYRADLILCR